MNNISQNLAWVRNKITVCTMRCGRSSEEVSLIAVSKNKTVDDITEAIKAGQLAFGENYVQEGVKKIRYFQKIVNPVKLEWHFIGSIQTNKSQLVAKYFDWCHTIDRLQIAMRLNSHRPETMGLLNVLIQINIDNENSKSGILHTEIDRMAAIITKLPRLRLRGLMAIPSKEVDVKKQFFVAQKMAMIFKKLKTSYSTVDTLSLGMSDDMETAITAGSTMVRIGTAIFGIRDYL